MGINGILPRILPSAGRENYDLRSLKDGLIAPSPNTNGPSRKRNRSESRQQSPQKRSWVRRKVRLAVDLNGWISRACHGHGAYLMDERHLSYHGRASLKSERANIAANGGGDDNPTAAAQGQRLEYVSKCVDFLLRRIAYLASECNARVLLVLDGSTPPIKRTAVDRRRDLRRKAARERDSNRSPQRDPRADEAVATENEALSRISASKRAGSGDDPALRRLLYSHLRSELRSRSIPFLIAPYEADGQLAYLSATGRVDAVITEDSDLICMGVDRLVYKLGGWNGGNVANRTASGLRGTLLCRSDLGSARGIDLLDFSDAMLVVMFVAAGCDYCESLRGIGIVTARDIVKEVFVSANWKEPVLKRVLEKLYSLCHKSCPCKRAGVKSSDDEEKEEAREAYEKAFLGAVAMFRHPLVYDPVLGHVIANDVSSDNNDDSARARLRPSFYREEEVLMQYEPYRVLVMDREALYQIVGRPSTRGTAHKMARGLIKRRTSSEPHEEVEVTIVQDEHVHFNQPAQGTTSGISGYSSGLQPSSQEFSIVENGTQPSSQEFSIVGSATQPSSQEFTVVGRGTQQSKSSSDKTLLSSLSPDLLASPSPVRLHNN